MTDIQPIEREKTLNEIVYDQLKRALARGSYEPGEKITMRSIAEAAAVSFTPAREAMGRLISEGALEYAGPKTVVVPVLDKHALDEITRIRKALESMVTREGAQHITQPELRTLRKIQDALERAMSKGNYREVLNRNEEFHYLIYRKSGFNRAVQMIESCWTRIGPSLNLLYPEFSIKQEGVHNHRRIIEDLEQGKHQNIPAHIERDIEAGYALLSKQFS